MANHFRHVRGDTNALALPAYTADSIEVGDLMWWDAANDAVRPASAVGGADYAAKKANLAANFIGVAMEAKDANTSGTVLVATAGDFVFNAPTGTGSDAEPLNYVAGGNGTSMVDQTVVKDASAGNAIGRVVAVKNTSQDYMMIRILSKFNLG